MVKMGSSTDIMNEKIRVIIEIDTEDLVDIDSNTFQTVFIASERKISDKIAVLYSVVKMIEGKNG